MSRFLENSTWLKIARKESRYLIQLVLTEKCNLSCVYCWQDHNGGSIINYAQVSRSLFALLESFNGTKRLCIHYFGGEPLLAFNIIKRLTLEVNQLWKIKNWPSENLIFEITTNGTLLNKKVKDWLILNKNVIPLLSLDGTPEMHNKNRCNSFPLIKENLPFFRSYGNPVKMTISQYTISEMAKGIKYIHSLGLECNANIVFENIWGSAKGKANYLKIFEQQLSELVDFYLENPEIPRSTIIPLLTKDLTDHELKLDSLGCGMGKNITSIDVDGKMYPCQRVTEFFKKEKLKNPIIERTDLKPEKCVICPLLAMCPECKANNYSYNNDTNHKTTFHCEFVQLQLRASAILVLSEMKKISRSNNKDTLSDTDKSFLSQRLQTALFIEKYTRNLHGKTIMN